METSTGITIPRWVPVVGVVLVAFTVIAALDQNPKRNPSRRRRR